MTTASDSPVRVNARLEPALARKLHELARLHGVSVTEVIKASIEHYHRASCGRGSDAAVTLRQVGFIGSGEAEAGLSQNYKQVLAKSLTRKHGHR